MKDIWNIKPEYSLAFNDNAVEIGKLEFRDGKFRFIGDAEESAKVFLREINRLQDAV